MKDFNKDKFNDSIRRKLDQAEVQPGNNVWEGIEAGLLKQENGKMQKRAAFYRNLAAAVIFIALISIYFNLQDFTFKVNQDTTLAPVELPERNVQKLFISNNDVFLAKPELIASDKEDDKDKSNFEGNAFAVSNNDNQTASNKSSSIENNQTIVLYEKEIGRESDVFISKIEAVSPALIEFPKLEVAVEEVSYFAVSSLDNPKEKSNLSWNTNVNIGSGSFNPNSEITETPLFSTVSTLNNPGTAGRTTSDNTNFNTKQERETVENLSSAPMQGNISFTLGLNFGVILNDKWNIKSGLQYGAYRSSSLSSTVLRDRNSDQLYPYHGASSSTEISDGRVVNVTSEYELYNDLHILTIPVMASYKVIDSKFDISLVAGLSGDFIVRNTLKGGSDQINEIQFSQGDKKSYKNFFASSIAGIEVSYPFADKYALSIMPTYKRALSNVTTDDATFSSMPAFMGLNMSLAYMF
ncbi:outer membrane beta-barrel protein [Marivirga harenae]|uniref:outer membrane beta-barrel protein n=1 Tax=Marivirga harenae TaxID=2010992 RepID=UPI0026DEEAD1|nr:outer membrane beta-barrel protein [Marivirga harenae]WKV12788.1 hypothetical protein Q3Y49_02970 [Marivirga harenae]